jgi:DNA-binding transcriptional ArsR family regulator
MKLSKADLIIHPIRLRILQVLSRDPATTHKISENLPDVPLSSLYRHLRLLLEGNMIAVSETRLIHGIEEKVYQLENIPRLTQEDLVDLSGEEHLQYFTIYLVTLLEGFGRYLESSPKVDYLLDRTGYTEIDLWATGEELDQLSQSINQSIKTIMENKPSKERRLQKFAIITYPQTGREI